MSNPSILLASALLAGVSLVPAPVSARPLRVDAVEVELVARQAAAVPGQPLQVGLRLRHDPGWHTYWRNPGDSGLPTELALTLPAGFAAGPIQWPAPERLPVGPLLNFGYDGEIVLPVTVAVPGALAGDRVALRGKAQWLVCKDVCVPGEAEVDLELPVRRDGAAADGRWASLFDTMAARTPRERIEASAAIDGRTLSLGLPIAPAGRVEFFPYEPGIVDNPAAQRLFALPAAEAPARIRLAVPLADGVDAAAIRKAGLFDAPAGVLVVDGVQATELTFKTVAALAAGDALPNASVAAAQGRAGGQGASGTSGGLLGALGASSGAGSSGLGAPGTGAAADAAAAAAAAPAPAPGVQALTLAGALLSALLGGLILNLMPCVFPVIGLKVLAFAQHDRDDPAAGRRHAAGFSIGIVGAFWLLAALLLGLRAAGQAAGWGFQLQSAGFVVAMALLFVGIGLNLSGVWEFGVALTRLGGLDRGGGSMLSAVASGALAVLVATPCTAPFMGSALGFTLGQPAPLALAVFTAIGLGMALPYLVLGLRPELLSRLPRPGRWMETVRQALAFPMYATAAWLAWVLGQQAGIDAVFGLSAGAVALAFAAWCHGRFVQRGGAHPVARLVTLVALVGCAALAWPPAGADDGTAVGAGTSGVAPSDGVGSGSASADAASPRPWGPWSDARVREALAQGHPVFVDFTAAWCVSCQVNKRLVLDRETVQRAFDERGVVRLRADWTRRDAAITAELARHGRNGVPLYLLLAPGAAPRALPELLTVDIVRDALSSLPPSSLPAR